MVTLHVERTIAAPPDKVFAYLADPAALAATPLVLRTGWTNGRTEAAVGAIREVLTTGFWFREEITAYDPPHSYSYLIIKSIPAFGHEGGTLTFTPVDEGTHVDWDTTYSHPLHGGGRVMDALTSRLLPQSFNAVLAGCAKALET